MVSDGVLPRSGRSGLPYGPPRDRHSLGWRSRDLARGVVVQIQVLGGEASTPADLAIDWVDQCVSAPGGSLLRRGWHAEGDRPNNNEVAASMNTFLEEFGRDPKFWGIHSVPRRRRDDRPVVA